MPATMASVRNIVIDPRLVLVLPIVGADQGSRARLMTVRAALGRDERSRGNLAK
jgi:hypothetical protein